MLPTYLQDLCAFATERKRQIFAKYDPTPTPDEDEEDNNLVTEADMITYLNIFSIAPSSQNNFPQPAVSNTLRSVTFPTDDHLLSTIHSIPSKSLQHSETSHRTPTPHTSSPTRRRGSNPTVPLSQANLAPCSLHTTTTSSCPHPIRHPPIISPSHSSPLQSISTILSANKTIQAWISSIPLHIALPNSLAGKGGWQAQARWSESSSQASSQRRQMMMERQELYTLICLGYDLYMISKDQSNKLSETNKNFLTDTKILLGVVQDVGNCLVEMENTKDLNSSQRLLLFNGHDDKLDKIVQENMARLEAIRVAVGRLLKGIEVLSLYEGYVCLLREGLKTLAKGRRVLDRTTGANSGKGFWIVCPVGAETVADILGDVALGLRRLRGDFVQPFGEAIEELGMFTQERLGKDRGSEVLRTAKEWLGVRHKRLGGLYTEYKRWDAVFGSIRVGYKVWKV
ncbi:hypothetical protein QBC44DRAFT_366684 [Cladorrhinum sp. PSN332]|nr:hypothetical protein QBC44DRAFT_366684 [Cladorrhinum sp. PSN332]